MAKWQKQKKSQIFAKMQAKKWPLAKISQVIGAVVDVQFDGESAGDFERA